MKGLGFHCLEHSPLSSAGSLTGERGSRLWFHVPITYAPEKRLVQKERHSRKEDRSLPSRPLVPQRRASQGQGAAQDETGPIPLGLSPATGTMPANRLPHNSLVF